MKCNLYKRIESYSQGRGKGGEEEEGGKVINTMEIQT
jgi:hypothetical protein